MAITGELPSIISAWTLSSFYFFTLHNHIILSWCQASKVILCLLSLLALISFAFHLMLRTKYYHTDDAGIYSMLISKTSLCDKLLNLVIPCCRKRVIVDNYYFYMRVNCTKPSVIHALFAFHPFSLQSTENPTFVLFCDTLAQTLNDGWFQLCHYVRKLTTFWYRHPVVMLVSSKL